MGNTVRHNGVKARIEQGDLKRADGGGVALLDLLNVVNYIVLGIIKLFGNLNGVLGKLAGLGGCKRGSFGDFFRSAFGKIDLIALIFNA